jgi:hypothetical protein
VLILIALSSYVFSVAFYRQQDKLIQKEFVGEYYEGDGLINCLLTLNEDNTFHFYGKGDIGNAVEIYGTYRINNGEIVMIHDRDNREGICIYNKLIPVMWGERRYLLPSEDSILGPLKHNFLCDAYKKDLEPRDRIYGMTYLRRKDINIQVNGGPTYVDGSPFCK